MRIHTLSEHTGISKRNIHFYIKEGLISPKADKENGYYDFSDEDEKRLILVKKLREAGLALDAIRSILHTPAAAEYHMRMHISRMAQQRKRMLQTEKNLRRVLKQISMDPDIRELDRLVTNNIKTTEDEALPYDGFLVNHYLWRSYWPQEELSEYQKYLWEKIIKQTNRREKNEDYAKLYDFLCFEDQKRVNLLYEERNCHYAYVARLSEEGIDRYVEKMKRNLLRFVQEPSAIRRWKELIDSQYMAMIKIYISEIGTLGEELCPLFKAYRTKSKLACRLVFEWLCTENGRWLRSELESILGDGASMETFDHAVLESMSCLVDSEA